MIRKINLKHLISGGGFLLLYFLMTNSMWIQEEASGSVRLFLFVIAISLILISKSRNLHIKTTNHRNIWIAFSVLLALHLFSIFLNGLYADFDIFQLLMMLLAAIVAYIIPADEFWDKYRKITIWISAFSLICYFSYLILPGIFNFIPTNVWRAGYGEYKNLIFSVIQTNMPYYYRNYGISIEPGMFQIFVSYALYLELFKREQPNIKVVLLYILTIITTQSTTGYITIFVFILASFLRRKSKIKNKYKRIIFAFSLIAICGVIYLYVNGYLSEHIFSKFQNVSTSGSAFERFRSLALGFKDIIANPIGGIGNIGFYTKYSVNDIIMVVTPMNFFALHGLLYGVICNLLFLKGAVDDKESVLCTCMLILGFLCMVISQNMSGEFFMFLLIFYNCSKTRIRKRIN